MFYVSQSKVNAWRRCKLQYHFRNHLYLKPKVKARPLVFGTLVHTLQEAVANGKSPTAELKAIEEKQGAMFREERELYGDIITDVGYIFKAYQEYWKKEPLKLIKVGKQTAEHSFEIELTPEITAKGRIDGLAQYRNFVSLLEHKNHKDFPNDDHRWRNLQSVVYIRIAQMLGWADPEGTLWNYVRSKPPTRPQLLKNGTLSERSIDSLPDVVIDTIKERGLDPRKYKAFIDIQRANLQSWFMRVFTPVKKDVLRTVFLEFLETAREMADYYAHDHKRPPPRTMDRHCSWCQYESICRAELQGNDVDFVIQHDYIVDKSEYQTGDENEELASA